MGYLKEVFSSLIIRIIRVLLSFLYGIFFGKAIKYEETLPEPTPQPQGEPPALKPSYRCEQSIPQSLPLEVLLHIFSFLELKSYIISRAVCKDWQHLLPLANIHPIRRRLFNLFRHMLEYPRFLETRAWTIENLHLFDREAYIDALLAQYPAIPDEFRMWVLEWPGRTAISCMWPGLPMVEYTGRSLEREEGVCWMSYGSPMLLSIAHKGGALEPRFIPALLLWKTEYMTRWLLFEKDVPGLFGRVLETFVREGEVPTVYSLSPSRDHDSDEDSRDGSEDGGDVDIPYSDWISFLEHLWDMMCDSDERNVFSAWFDKKRARAVPIGFPVQYELSSAGSTVLPSPPWVDCHAPVE